jgi:hypothetical protein
MKFLNKSPSVNVEIISSEGYGTEVILIFGNVTINYRDECDMDINDESRL